MAVELEPKEQQELQETRAQHRHDGVIVRLGLALSALLMVAGQAVRLRAAVAAGSLAFTRGHGPGRALMTAGILTLALTPAARVGGLLVAWVRERDWRFVMVALAIVATLSLAALLGGG